MKWSIDGDQVCITKDDFVDLQESPAVFLDRDCPLGELIERGGWSALALADLCWLQYELQADRASMSVRSEGEGANEVF